MATLVREFYDPDFKITTNLSDRNHHFSPILHSLNGYLDSSMSISSIF